MPRKEQGWITFQSSEAERQILEQHCQQQKRTKTEILRELVRSLAQQSAVSNPSLSQSMQGQGSFVEVELLAQRLEYQAMKVSARNALKGIVKQVIVGTVNTEVTIEIAPGVAITSIITKTSAEQLGLAEGKEAYAVIKSSDVMIAVD